MSKVILEFNLPDEEQPMTCAMNGFKYQMVLNEIDSILRQKLKYGDLYENGKEEAAKAYEEIRDDLYELLKQFEVSL